MGVNSAQTIQIEYMKIMNQASELTNYANDLNALAARMDALIDSLKKGWQGGSAAAYLGKCSTLRAGLRTNASELNEAASKISSMAAAYRKAEMDALEIAQTRTTGLVGGGRSGGGF